MNKTRDKVIHMSTQELKAIFNDKSLSPQDRGEIGERAVSRIAMYWASRFRNHISATSYMYPQGDIIKSTGSKAGDNPITEIDTLIVTPYRILCLEIKTVYGDLKIYPNSEIELTRDGEFKGEYEKKNYLQQNESHARHLYFHLHDLLPNGSPQYIIPLVIFAGNMTIEDGREHSLSERYPITTASDLYQTLEQLNTPLENLLDVDSIRERLSSIRVMDKQLLLDSQNFEQGMDNNVKKEQEVK